MKLCIISPSFPDMKCGVGDFVARLVENIAGLVDKVTIISSDNPKIRKTKEFGGFENVQIQPLVKEWNFLSLFFLIKSKLEEVILSPPINFDTIFWNWVFPFLPPPIKQKAICIG